MRVTLDYWMKFLKNKSKTDKKELNQKKEELLVHIGFYQHERLIHLIITLAFACFLLFSLVLLLWKPTLPILGLFLILLIMVGFYVRYYYILENGVQQLYQIYNSLIEK